MKTRHQNNQSQTRDFPKKILINLLCCGILIPTGFFGGYLTRNWFLGQIQPQFLEKIPFLGKTAKNLDQAFKQAQQAAILTQTAVSSEDWQKVVQYWQEAITLLQKIPPSSSSYQLAQEKLATYQINYNYAKNNSLNPPYLHKATKQAILATKQSEKAKNRAEWQEIADLWQEAIVLIEKVSPQTPQYSLAQQKLVIYRQNQQQALQRSYEASEFRNAVNQAMEAAIFTQTAKTKQQWQQVGKLWQKAIALMKAVPPSDPHYNIAQSRIKQYQNNLNYALVNIANAPSQMSIIKTIFGQISPKSVVHSGQDLFFAQNMMYNHNITVYNRNFQLVKTISDTVKLSDFGYPEFPHSYQGSPVEVAFSHDGKYAWVSNYQMYGQGFSRPGNDQCSAAANHDPSFLYRINTENLIIEKVIKVGAVPKFVAVSPNNKFVLVSNWCSWDLSIIDIEKNQTIKTIKLGRYPRGIVVDSKSENAYIAIMGSNNIAKVNLQDFSVNWLNNIGSSPRHLVKDSQDQYLYASLNSEGQIAKIDLKTGKVIQKVATGSAPRSMAISADDRFIYVVNYSSNTVSKVNTKTMQVVQSIAVNSNPIGITYDPKTKQVWVACYSGSIVILQD